MNIFIFALGTLGDINPMLGIGRELKFRGNHVTFLTNDYFENKVVDAGLNFLSVGSKDQYIKGNSANAWNPDDNMDNFEFYHAPSFECAYEVMKNYAGRDDVILLAIGEQNGAVVAAQQYNIPYIKFVLSPNLIFSAESPPAPLCWRIPRKMPRFLTRFLLKRGRKSSFKEFYRLPSAQGYLNARRRLGCPPTYMKKSLAALQIGFFPEWFGMRPKDWPSNLKLVGFPLHDPRNVEPHNCFERTVDEQGIPILFTPGTGVPDASEMFIEGRKICEALELPGVFIGGGIGKHVLEGSALCRHIEYVDFEYALKKSLLLVHHGGIGSMSQAIRAGIPQLIRPVKYDQPDNANRIHKLGLGTFVMPLHFKAEKIIPIIRSLIEQVSKNKSLTTYSADIKRSNAIQKACDLIEQQARTLKSNRVEYRN